MSISYINTREVEEISKELFSLSLELDKEINSLFLRFSEVPTVTGEWVGNKSQFYFNRIANDKKQYNEFSRELREMANKLSSDVYNVQSCMKKNLIDSNQKEV